MNSKNCCSSKFTLVTLIPSWFLLKKIVELQNKCTHSLITFQDFNVKMILVFYSNDQFSHRVFQYLRWPNWSLCLHQLANFRQSVTRYLKLTCPKSHSTQVNWSNLVTVFLRWPNCSLCLHQLANLRQSVTRYLKLTCPKSHTQVNWSKRQFLKISIIFV